MRRGRGANERVPEKGKYNPEASVEGGEIFSTFFGRNPLKSPDSKKLKESERKPKKAILLSFSFVWFSPVFRQFPLWLYRRPIGRHAQGAVDADRLAVDVAVLNDVDCERGIFVRLAEAGGNGTEAPSESGAAWGRPAIIGVMKTPGAMAFTRMPNWANSRAIGSVMPTTPPLEAE